MKFLRVTMPDGSKWDVPVEVIAKNRATYYAELESRRDNRDFKTVFDEEFRFTLNNSYELIDWASNNMNWAEVRDQARKATEPVPQRPDYQEGWVNGEKEIVEK